MFRLFVTPLLILLHLSPLGDARQSRRPARDTNDESCLTNAECLQKGLPLISPRGPQQRARRQNGQAFVPFSTTTCGTAETVFLPSGQYQVSLRGARGATNGRTNADLSVGGPGAVITATFLVASNITVGYFIGCTGVTFRGDGGGGGGSFVYLVGPSQPAILVAGGGGGGGFTGGRNGQPAGITFDGTATNQDGLPGSTSGNGGSSGPGNAGAGGGGGFITAGGNEANSATGGSQSINHGGTFGGGTTFGTSSTAVTGGAGSGGGAGFFGGGGGGGWSGGGGGASGIPQTGGGGGGTYANPGIPGGITVIPLTARATSEGIGALTIVKIT